MFTSMLDIGDKQNLGDTAAGIVYIYCRLITIMVTFKVDCLEWNYDPAYLPLVDSKYRAPALLLVYFWNL